MARLFVLVHVRAAGERARTPGTPVQCRARVRRLVLPQPQCRLEPFVAQRAGVFGPGRVMQMHVRLEGARVHRLLAAELARHRTVVRVAADAMLLVGFLVAQPERNRV